MTEDQSNAFDRLPKWAKQHIKNLERDVETLTKKLDEMYGARETNTYILDGLQKRPLPKNSPIEFHAGLSGTDRVTVYIRSNGTVDVNYNGVHDMVIIPAASNAAYIGFVNMRDGTVQYK